MTTALAERAFRQFNLRPFRQTVDRKRAASLRCSRTNPLLCSLPPASPKSRFSCAEFAQNPCTKERTTLAVTKWLFPVYWPIAVWSILATSAEG